MLLEEQEHDFFWAGHAQLGQVSSVVVTVLLLVVAVITKPVITPPRHVTPVNFTTVQDHFIRTMNKLYHSRNTSFLATPPLLRQILYHNLLPCEPNFLESHNTSDCDVEAKQDVRLYLGTLTDVPDPFEHWPAELCGEKPFSAARNRYTTGQGFFPSRKCEFCFLPRSGYVLRLPFSPQQELHPTLFSACVVDPMTIWFKGHVKNDTSAIIADAIFISTDQRTIERQQLSYERLLPLDLWWSTSRPVRHYRRDWLGGVAAFLGFVVFVQQVATCKMERHCKGSYVASFRKLARNCLRFLLIALSLALFFFFSMHQLHWNHLLRALTAGPPSHAVARQDSAQHAYVLAMYHAFTSHTTLDTNVVWALLVLLLLQVTDLLTCTPGYLYGTSRAARRLLAPLLVAGCWAALLGLLTHVFHHEENITFRSLRASFRSLFVTRYLAVHYEHEASVHLLLLLHVTVFLLVPLFLAILLANLNAAWELKRGGGRWWAGGGR